MSNGGLLNINPGTGTEITHYLLINKNHNLIINKNHIFNLENSYICISCSYNFYKINDLIYTFNETLSKLNCDEIIIKDILI